MEEVATGLTGSMSDGAFPHLQEMIAEHALRPGYDYAAEFDYGLNLILDGLARR